MHVRYDRRVGGLRIVNAGSVGLPYEAQPGAYWAILGPDVELRRTEYDIDAMRTRPRARVPATRTSPRRASLVEPIGRDEALEYFEQRRRVARSFVREARQRVGPEARAHRPDHRAARAPSTRTRRSRSASATPLELLVSVMLSAQTTDVNVNRVTQPLFEKYRRPEDYLAVPQEELERDIFATGFFRQKAKSLRGTMRMLLEEFDGEVPRRLEELCGCRASRGRRRTSSLPSSASRRGSSSTRTCGGSRSGSA